MTVLEQIGDEGELKCLECDVWFTVIFNRNPVYSRIEYCPFCGEEIEEIISESDEGDE